MAHNTDGATGAPQDVAIVGLSCRFSGDATSADGFWEMLCGAKCKSSDWKHSRPDVRRERED